MSESEKYTGFKWVKVKRYVMSPDKTWEERYAELEKHHYEETNFLIEKVRELASQIDSLKQAAP